MFKRSMAIALVACIPSLGMAQVVGAPPNGRLLASNCFQCHGTNGKAVSGFERLAGMSASELKSELAEMKLEGEDGIMAIHAAGYTDAQIAAMAAYFASVK
jgi:sulfide dehydrogenase cytochrome subunit